MNGAVDVCAADLDGTTPCYIAAEQGHAEALRVLHGVRFSNKQA